MAPIKLNLVVAACNNRGIGINGQLPWRLKGDMAFFKRITLETKDPKLQNAVIMGRKTWDSIPAKFRPLSGRINIILSKTLTKAPEGASLVSGLTEALDLCQSEDMSGRLEEVFIIGGSSLYQLALKSSHPLRVYYTQVHADIECDTFLPEMDKDAFTQIQITDIDTDMKEENGMKYQFEVYERS